MSDTTPQQRAVEQKVKAKSMEAALKVYAPQQLPFWHDETRAIANELTRCGLISCRSGGVPRRYFDNEKLFSTGKSTVFYKGEELRGNDEETFLTLVHMLREAKAGKLVVRTTSAELCRLNGWESRQVYYNEIYKSVQRLSAGSLTIYSRRISKMRRYQKARDAGVNEAELARLWDEIRQEEDDRPDDEDDGQPGNDEAEGEGLIVSMVGSRIKFEGSTGLVNKIPQGNLTWEIPLEEEMVFLFAKQWLTLMPQPSRRKLSTGGRRLQAYYMGHRKPYAVLVSTLAGVLQLDDSKGRIKENKRIVKKRLQELVDARVLDSFELDEGLGDVRVHVKRGAMIDQARLEIDAATENDTPEQAG
jgi:hypothetical protein